MSDDMSFGPAFDEKVDGARIRGQLETIRQYMLSSSRSWYTLAEIHAALGYPEASISADLRHLKKKQHGEYDVQKRRRDGAAVWEYRVREPILTPGELPY